MTNLPSLFPWGLTARGTVSPGEPGLLNETIFWMLLFASIVFPMKGRMFLGYWESDAFSRFKPCAMKNNVCMYGSFSSLLFHVCWLVGCDTVWRGRGRNDGLLLTSESARQKFQTFMQSCLVWPLLRLRGRVTRSRDKKFVRVLM